MTAPVAMIEAEAYKLGFRAVWIRDESLFLPSGDWVRVFAAGLPSALEPCGIDCDDFAIGAVHFANVALKRSGHRSGHSFGYADGIVGAEYRTILNVTGRHAFNLCRTHENEWLLIEPQAGRVESLADARGRGAVIDLGRLFL